MNMSTSGKILIGLIITTGIVCSALVMFYLHIQSVHEEDGRLSQKMAHLQVQQEQLQERERIYEENRSEISQLRSYFVRPGTEGSASFLSRVERIGSTTGATVQTKSLSPESSDDKDDIRSLTSMVVITGSWQEVYQTVALVETLPFDVSIRKAQFTLDNEARARWRARLDLDVLKRISESGSQGK